MSGRTTGLRVEAAQARAKAARTRLGTTITELKQRVSPQALAQDAAATLKDKGLALVDGAAKRPAAMAAVLGGIVLLLARKKLFGLLHRETPAGPESLSPKPKSQKRTQAMTDSIALAADTPKTKRGKAAKAGKAVSTASARDLAARTAVAIEANPMSVLAGGIALGALAGAFLPRSARETQLLAPVGKRITETVTGAVDAAKDTAKSEFDVLGLTRNAARDQASKLLEGVLGAIATAAAAALTSARDKKAAGSAKE